jgi:SAM-dependent methyltransferase
VGAVTQQLVTPRISYIDRCRACGSANVVKFLNLPDMPFTDDFIPPQQFGQEFRADIDVYVCGECMCAQTQHDVDVQDYYEDYHYSVGASATVGRFMRLLAENLKAAYFPDASCPKVLEVGSGDGEQLVAFRDIGFDVLGYEPSSILCGIAESKGIQTIQGLFDSDSIDSLPADFQKVDVIMLSYTFDHLPRPREFLSACRSILDSNHGLLVVEIHDLEKIVDRQEYCLFEHEHSIYLTERTATNLCHMEDFEIIDFDLVPDKDRRGNSLIFVATPTGSQFASRPAQPRTAPEFGQRQFYDSVERDIRRGIANLDEFAKVKTEGGKMLAGYGAGGRGVMTLAAMQQANRFAYLADRNPKRSGLLVPKSGVRLVGIEELESTPADDVLVFSFGYMREIREALAPLGYGKEQLHSLLDVLAGRY